MGLFGNRGKKTSIAQDRKTAAEARKVEKEEQKAQTLEMIKESRTEALKLKVAAEYDAKTCINRARKAISNKDETAKAIAFNELRMHLGLYYYARAMETNLRIMESNAKVQDISRNFAEIVNRMNKMKVTNKTTNLNDLVRDAMKGMTAVDLDGVEDLMTGIMNGVASANKVKGVNDQFLEDLVSGKRQLGDPIEEVEEKAETGEVTEASLEELLRRIEE